MPAVPNHLDAVRAQLPSLASEVHMNAGGCGPLPIAAARALEGWATQALAGGRGSGAGFGATADAADALRAAAARVVGGAAQQIALTAHTTGGVNVVAWGIDWRPGDEIVMPALEHPGMSVPLATIARRHGVVLRLVNDDGTGATLADELARAVGPRTRLVAMSHVSWATGAVLDVAAAARIAHDAGALLLVDGAQAAGAIPVDAPGLGADAYAFPAQKWLLGPEGLGALWISAGALARIDLTHSGYESGTGHGAAGAISLHPGARRHEVSTPPAALMPAWSASIEWLEQLGWTWVHDRVAQAQEAARTALAAVPGVTVVTPPGRQAGLVTFTVRGCDPVETCAALAARGIVLRWLERPYALRVSTGFFTSDADIARLAAGVAAVAARDDC